MNKLILYNKKRKSKCIFYFYTRIQTSLCYILTDKCKQTNVLIYSNMSTHNTTHVQDQMFLVTCPHIAAFPSLQDSRHDRLLLRCQPRLLRRTRPARLGHGRLRGGEHRTGHQGLCVTQFPPLPAPFLPL